MAWIGVVGILYILKHLSKSFKRFHNLGSFLKNLFKLKYQPKHDQTPITDQIFG